jgi:hypothetical protein
VDTALRHAQMLQTHPLAGHPLMFHTLWGQLALIMSALAGTAALADSRRMKRRDFDRVGFMPWPAIMVLAMTVAVFATSLAIKCY